MRGLSAEAIDIDTNVPEPTLATASCSAHSIS
jgi:hypothetical protein